MGCGASRPEEDDDVVSLCRERKRLLKSAIDRRYSLADAHSRYNDSLNGVAAAIKLFVARHSSPLSPFLITFPSASDTDTTQPSNPMLLSQTLSDSTHLAIGRKSPDSVIPSESSEEESEDGEADGNVCEHFYGEMAPPMAPAPAPQGDFTWDFFYPFDTVRTGVGLGNGLGQSSEDDDLRRIRMQEGIPELEEDGEREKGLRKDVSQMNGGGVEVATATGEPSPDQEHKGLKVIDTEATGRELLEALKDVEDYFVRAYESGFDVSRLLEVNRVHLMSSLEEIKGLFLFIYVANLLLCIRLLQTCHCKFCLAHFFSPISFCNSSTIIELFFFLYNLNSLKSARKMMSLSIQSCLLCNILRNMHWIYSLVYAI